MYIAPQTREEDATSLNTAMAMRATFAPDCRAVLALFDALVELLTGGERKQYRACSERSGMDAIPFAGYICVSRDLRGYSGVVTRI